MFNKLCENDINLTNVPDIVSVEEILQNRSSFLVIAKIGVS